MTRRIRPALHIFAALFFVVSAGSVYASEKLVISAIENGTVLTRICKAILEKTYGSAGLQIEFVDYPGKRAVAAANNGITDGELVRSKRAELLNENLVRVEFPVITDEMAAFSINVKGPITSPEALKGYTIGFRRGSAVPAKITEGTSRIQFDSFEQGIRLLENKRIDIMLYFKIPATVEIRDKFPNSKIHRISENLIMIPLYHYLHKRNRHLAPKIEKALRRLVSSGERDQIIEDFLSGG
jgi:ABC-type amino acid transport substrate-binding protein